MLGALPKLLDDLGDRGMFFHAVVINVIHGDIARMVKLGAFDRDDAIAAAIVVACDDEGGDFGGNAFGQGAAIGAQIAGDANAPAERVDPATKVCAADGGGDEDEGFDLGPPFGMAGEYFQPNEAPHGVADDADGGEGVFGLSLVCDRFDTVNQRFDANPSVDEAKIGDDDFRLRAGHLVSEFADA